MNVKWMALLCLISLSISCMIISQFLSFSPSFLFLFLPSFPSFYLSFIPSLLPFHTSFFLHFLTLYPYVVQTSCLSLLSTGIAVVFHHVQLDQSNFDREVLKSLTMRVYSYISPSSSIHFALHTFILY